MPPAQAALDAYLATVKRFVVRAASVGRTEPQEPTDVAASLDRMLKPIHLPDDPVAASYAIGGMLQIELSRKQQLLEIPDAAAAFVPSSISSSASTPPGRRPCPRAAVGQSATTP